MTAPHDGADPLLAAILDEPPPRSASHDPAYLTEYESARTDLATLRAQLNLLADALTEESPDAAPPQGPAPAAGAGRVAGPAPRPGRGRPAGRGTAPRPVRGGPGRSSRRPRGARRARGVALRGLVAAGVVAVALGFGWLAVQGGAGDGAASGADTASAGEARPGDPAERGVAADGETAGSGAPGGKAAGSGAAGVFEEPGYLACARLVAEGDVLRVAPVSGSAEVRVTLRVTRVYKADRSAKEAVVALTGPLGFGVGDHVLVAVPRRADGAGAWLVGERTIAPRRDRLARAQADAPTGACG
ncbi:hypothetical protein [Streptomyces sp. NPDC093260]|uniref:hypothetical protein n=1 Tax=Streptomyces sp. NPDC093260 TaxID=3155073 RepID=UPI00341B9434